jgi:hypothetical protein
MRLPGPKVMPECRLSSCSSLQSGYRVARRTGQPSVTIFFARADKSTIRLCLTRRRCNLCMSFIPILPRAPWDFARLLSSTRA